ncbi:MAG: hypothetical protein JWQ38_1322 [Flavipsychrobacter sp.]|nr:hypothetical protein [Flavipsychrobacter sp.]
MTDKTSDADKKITDEYNLRTLINNIDDPIWLVDADYIIIECNIAFGKWVHCFIGTTLTNGDHVLHNGQNKAYQEKFEMCYQLALSGRSFQTVEDMQVGKDTRYTSVTFKPVYENDKVVRVSCYARDITEQRKHLLKIEEQNTALREIAFIESHKVRGPVTTIMGLEQLFNHEDFTDPINKIIVEGISRTTKDLDLIVREVVLKSNAIDKT